MDIGPNLGVPDPAPAKSVNAQPQLDNGPALEADIGKRFEQLLWAEMLSHAGLEKALTQSGGEAASAFSRYVVEAIAADISERHPLGLSHLHDVYDQNNLTREIKNAK
jgi:hypothetical protein